MIPAYVVIDEKTEDSVRESLDKINYNKDKVTIYDVDSIYRCFYNIYLSVIKKLGLEI